MSNKKDPIEKELEALKDNKEFIQFKEDNKDLSGKDLLEKWNRSQNKNDSTENDKSDKNKTKTSDEDKGKSIIIQKTKGGDDTDTKGDDENNPNYIAWKSWADKNNYQIQSLDEKDYDYAFKICKTNDDKTTSDIGIIKCKGDVMSVDSKDFEFYRELMNQAKNNKYENVNIKDDFEPEQAQMAILAALEKSLKISGNLQQIDLNNKVFANLTEEQKGKALKFNQDLQLSQNISKAVAAAKEFKKAKPDGKIPFKPNEKGNPIIDMTNIYAIYTAGCELDMSQVKKEDLTAIKPEVLDKFPEKYREDMQKALFKFNKNITEEKKSRNKTDEKEQGADKKTPKPNNKTKTQGKAPVQKGGKVISKKNNSKGRE